MEVTLQKGDDSLYICCPKHLSSELRRAISLAVEGLNPEKNGIKEILVPKKSEFFCLVTYPKSTKIHLGETILQQETVCRLKKKILNAKIYFSFVILLKLVH